MTEYYRELHEALDAMPVKKLITGHFYLNGCFCTVGALRNARFKRRVDKVQEGDDNLTAAQENDSFEGTEEERHAHMLAYAKERV